MSQEIKRLYNYDDETMLVKAQVMHDNLVSAIATFTSYFPWVVAATATALQTSIDLANSLALDTQVLANLKVLTADANAQVQLGNAALSTLGIYARLAYPNDNARQRVFGQDQWAAARSDQEKMMNALEHAYSMCTTMPYNSDLIAKGYTATQIANLLSIANSIRTRNQMQEDAKSLRPVTTQNRIVQYNSVWEQMQIINVCSKLAFANDPAKLEQYKLYPSSTEKTSVGITIVKNGTTSPLADATVTITNTALSSAISDAGGKVYFESVNMPDLIDVHIDHPAAGSADYTNLSIVPGSTNDFVLEVPGV